MLFTCKTHWFVPKIFDYLLCSGFWSWDFGLGLVCRLVLSGDEVTMRAKQKVLFTHVNSDCTSRELGFV